MGKHNVVEYPAQDQNLPSNRALAMLAESISSLKDVRFVLENQHPSKERRAELKRRLSGVLAAVEIIRQAIRE